jgi:prolyl oligopeptidase
MARTSYLLCSLLLLAIVLPGCTLHQYSQEPLQYPVARQMDQTDDYHGTLVKDPYRWLEDPDSPETRAWIEAENKITFAWLEEIPCRDKIADRLTDLWNYEKYSAPYKVGDRYFFSKNDGLQSQSVLYYVNSLDDEPHVLLDPNKLSEDGTVALSGTAISDDGNLIAYAISEAGSDWQEWFVREVATGRDRPDHLKWMKFRGIAWTPDNAGFFYTRYEAPKEGAELQDLNKFPKVYYHKLGDEQSADKLVYHRPDDGDLGFGCQVTDDGRYLIIYVSRGTERLNGIWYKDLKVAESEVKGLLTDFDAQYSFVDNEGPVFWFRTDKDAPRGRVVAIDTQRPAMDSWKEIIPQSNDALRGVSVLDDKFVCAYLAHAQSKIRIFDLDGKFIRNVDLPSIGSAGGFGGKRDYRETFYTFSNFMTPPTIYRYDMRTGESTLFRRPDVDFNPDDYLTKQVFYASKDGTLVPMFITHKKGIRLDNNNPTFLYGYGGFNIPITPHFSVSRLVWMEMGGIYAVANIRGGGEYGKEWHQAGAKLNRQNVFDDFIAAGEWLCSSGYTQPEKLSINGGSNGGLLVAACTAQRPDLFGAAIPEVGVLDMLRFHKFTIGWAWVSDYGSPDDPEEFAALYKYSPLHNLKKGTHYPATLIMTGDHDDRVVPAHSFKYAAALQAAQGGPDPVLIRIETRAGHGAGKPTEMRIQEAADKLAFLVRALGMRN